MDKHVRKDIFVDQYKQLDVVEDCVNFLKKMEELKLYMIEFKEDSTKIFLLDCIVEDENWQHIIMIIYDKCTFFANDSIWKV